MRIKIKNEINYSVIIPHKNTPILLQRCLHSIPRREDIQIIIIDDNSEPEKVDFEQFPGLNDPSVEVIFTKEGKGAGYARNVGLAKAVGKWLLFADADDFFNYCINDIFDEYMNSSADIVYFKHNSVDSNTYITTYRGTGNNDRVNKWLYSIVKDDLLLRYRHLVVWSKLYRKEMIDKNNILFDEISISNDTTFAYLSGFYAISISADPRALYCSTIRQGSIRQKKRNVENRFDQFYVSCKRYWFFKKHNIPIHEKIPLVSFLVKFYLAGGSYFYNARSMLKKFEFSLFEIIRLCGHDIMIYMPKLILKSSLIRNKLGKQL